MYENKNAWHGNEKEIHLQDEINKEYMEKEFPFLKLLKIQTVDKELTVVGRETGKDTEFATYVWKEND